MEYKICSIRDLSRWLSECNYIKYSILTSSGFVSCATVMSVGNIESKEDDEEGTVGYVKVSSEDNHLIINARQGDVRIWFYEKLDTYRITMDDAKINITYVS